MTLQSADEHYARQKRIARAALIQARKARFGSVDRLLLIVSTAQLMAAQDSADSVPYMLSEQGIRNRPAGEVSPAAFAGVASDGRDLGGLLEFLTLPQVAPYQFDRAVLAQVQDAGRAASSAAIVSRPNVGGYVRMLVPPSCGRCAILAGKWFRWNQGFQRHPRCDCRHIPAAEDNAGSLTTDPRRYFDSLSGPEQERAFTVNGAKAIRDGADPIQVVNARAGMSTAQAQLRGPGDRWTAAGRLEARRVYGQNVFTTTEGVTRRGQAYRAMKSQFQYAQEADVKQKGKRYAQLRSPRLMPESIYQIAEDRADAIRLLRLYGYIT